MTSVPTMAEDMKQRTREEEQVREIPVEVRPMLGDEEETDDGKEPQKNDVAATHE